MASSVFDTLVHHLQEEVEATCEDVIDGMQDQGAYRERCGIIKGLRRAIIIIKDYEKKLMDD